MPEWLFTSGQAPSAQTNETPGPTIGIVIESDVAATITHMAAWIADPVPANAATLPFVLYDSVSQEELARFVPGSLVVGRNEFELPVPVHINAGQAVIPAIKTSDRYRYTANMFQTVGLVNGHLSTPATGDDPIGNGRFATGADAYPSGTFGGHNYWIEIGIVPDGEEHDTTGTAAAAVSASATAVKVGISAGTAAVAPAASSASGSSRTTSGTAALTALGSAVAAPVKVSSSPAAATVTATGVTATVRVTAGTASVVATGSNYTAQGAPGPWLVSRNRDPRIVTRVQVAN